MNGLNKLKLKFKGGTPYKHVCSFCSIPCEVAFNGLCDSDDKPADQTRACKSCYRKQYKRTYPGVKLPV